MSDNFSNEFYLSENSSFTPNILYDWVKEIIYFVNNNIGLDGLNLTINPFLNDGKETVHFHYFKNENSLTIIISATGVYCFDSVSDIDNNCAFPSINCSVKNMISSIHILKMLQGKLNAKIDFSIKSEINCYCRKNRCDEKYHKCTKYKCRNNGDEVGALSYD